MGFKEDISLFTGEPIILLKNKCKCGHTINFIRNHYAICSHCGRKVYPNKKIEFQEKLIKELRKNEHSNN